MSETTIAKAIVKGVCELAGNSDVQKMVFGTFSDGSARSLADCVHGETLSPEQRDEILGRGKKKSKAKKSKKNANQAKTKKKKRHAKIKL